MMLPVLRSAASLRHPYIDPQLPEAAEVMACAAGLVALEVVWSEALVEGARREHVPDRREDRLPE